MTKKVNILLPIGESLGLVKATLAPRLQSLQGKTIGVLSNSWQCMTFFADELRMRLVSDYGAKEVINFEAQLTLPMAPALMAEAIERCDAAIVGMGT